MFILRYLLRPLQTHFSDTALGQERAALFAYTLLAIMIPFTSSMTSYPWAQNVVSIGLLKRVKGRWACLFFDFRFYLALKTMTAQKANAKIKGKRVPFETKLAQAAQMLTSLGQHPSC